MQRSQQCEYLTNTLPLPWWCLFCKPTRTESFFMTSRTLIKASLCWNYMPPSALSCHIEDKKTVRMMSNLGAFYLRVNCLFPDSYMFAHWFTSGEKSTGGFKLLHLYERHLIILYSSIVLLFYSLARSYQNLNSLVV